MDGMNYFPRERGAEGEDWGAVVRTAVWMTAGIIVAGVALALLVHAAFPPGVAGG